MQTVDTVREAWCWWVVRMWSLWLALERVRKVGLVVTVRSLGERGTGFVIGYVALSRIGEQGEDRCDFSSGSSLASRDGD